MNIYISPENEKLLQKYKDSGKSMSGLINAMVIEHFNHNGYVKFVGDEKLMLREFYSTPTNEQLAAHQRLNVRVPTPQKNWKAPNLEDIMSGQEPVIVPLDD